MRPHVKRHAVSLFSTLCALFIMAPSTWATLSHEGEEGGFTPSSPSIRTPYVSLSPQSASPFNLVDIAYGNLQHAAHATGESMELYVSPLIHHLRQHITDGVIATYLDLAQQYVQKTYFDSQLQQSYRPTLGMAIDLIWSLDKTVQHYNPHEAIPTMERLFHLIVDELFSINPAFHERAFVAFHTGFEATNYRENVATLILRTAIRMLGNVPDIDLFMNIHNSLIPLAMPGMNNFPALENHFQTINAMLSVLDPRQLPPALQALDQHSSFINLQRRAEQNTPTSIIGQFSPIQSDAGYSV